MTRKSLLMITGFMVAVGTAAAFAAVGDDAVRAGRHGMHHDGGKWRHGGGHGLGLKALDTDKDGDVTLAEFLVPAEKRFAELDKDNTGFLDAAKLTAAFTTGAGEKSGSGEPADRMLKRLDRDGDGKVSLAEFLEQGHGWRGRGHGRHHGKWRQGGAGDRQAEADKAADASAAKADASAAKAGDEPAAGEAQETGEVRGRGWRGGRHGHHGGGWGGNRHAVGSMEQRIARFKALDKNGDGFVDKAELQASVDAEIAYRVKRMLHTLDADKNGRISKDEFLAPDRQRFARMDLNEDGKITADDLPPRLRDRWAVK